MGWLKFTHTEGEDLVNLDKILRIKKTSEVQVTIYDSNSIIPLTFEFSDEIKTNQFIYKLTQVLDTINLDELSVEYFTRD
jgi:hypothetical protein